MTDAINITGPAGTIEAEVDRPDGAPTAVAVLCHPHPLYGGSMHDGVLERLAAELLARDCICVRFNFRGVGASGGHFDNGDGESDDLTAVAGAARDLAPGLPLLLVGYSFGAWVAWRAAGALEPRHLLLVAPPVGMLTFSGEAPAGSRLDLFVGDGDDFAPADIVRNWAASLATASAVHLIAGADHFFTGALARLADAVADALTGPT